MTTPEILTKLMLTARCNQAQLAKAMNKTESRISEYMTGAVGDIKLQTFLKACEALKVHPRDVLTHFELMSLTTCEGVANPNKNK